MRPVFQSETELGRGSCVAACLASILELAANEVPNFRLATDPWTAMQEWLGQRGLYAIRVVAQPTYVYPLPPVHCILSGRSPRRDVGHAVVGLAEGRSWRILHDPHPDGGGLRGEPEWVTFLGQLS